VRETKPNQFKDERHEYAHENQEAHEQDHPSVAIPETFPEFNKRLWRGSDGLPPDRAPIHRGLSMWKEEIESMVNTKRTE